MTLLNASNSYTHNYSFSLKLCPGVQAEMTLTVAVKNA